MNDAPNRTPMNPEDSGNPMAQGDGADVNARLRAAVKSAEVPPFLEARIRSQIRAAANETPRKRWTLRWATAGIALGTVMGAMIAYQVGYLRYTAESQEAYFSSLSTHVATLLRVGLGDHVHCAFFRKFPADAPSRETFESGLGEQYKDLIPVVEKFVPAEYKLVLAHQCRYHGRKFVHLSLKNDQQLMSLIITSKNDGDSFNVEGTIPALVEAGIPVYTGGVQRFQIAAIETDDHLAYFISDLPGEDNTRLMQSMAASIKNILENNKG